MVTAHEPLPQALHVSPALAPHGRVLLLDLTGHPTGGGPTLGATGGGPTVGGHAELVRIWRGQPRSRSPWLPCGQGCCLVPAPGAVGHERAAWLRFLVREVLAPRSVAARARCAQVGLGAVHLLHGTVTVRASGQGEHRITVAGHRVRDRRDGPGPLGAEAAPGRGLPRPRGQVVHPGPGWAPLPPPS